MKEKTMANLEQYRAVLDDLMKQRAVLNFKIGEIDSAVAALRRLMPVDEIASPVATQLPMAISNGRYAGMSVRWAVLNLLAEDAVGPMDTGAVAEALAAGGITSNGKSLAANVSAVLSDMKNARNEVTTTPNGWVITQAGKQGWIHAKASRDRKPTLMEQIRESSVQ
jgi:hypothetical protein